LNYLIPHEPGIRGIFDIRAGTVGDLPSSIPTIYDIDRSSSSAVDLWAIRPSGTVGLANTQSQWHLIYQLMIDEQVGAD
jgi:hypothetical protein